MPMENFTGKNTEIGTSLYFNEFLGLRLDIVP